MKKLTKILLVITGLYTSYSPVFAQSNLIASPQPIISPTNTAPDKEANIFSTWQILQNWASSQDTNIDLSLNRLELFTGLDYQNNVNVSVPVGAWFKIYKNLGGELLFRNAGVAGTVLSEQVGLNLNLYKYDIKVTGGIDGGWRNDLERGYVEPYFEFDKATSRINSLFVRLGADLYFGSKSTELNSNITPIFSFGTKLNFW